MKQWLHTVIHTIDRYNLTFPIPCDKKVVNELYYKKITILNIYYNNLTSIISAQKEFKIYMKILKSKNKVNEIKTDGKVIKMYTKDVRTNSTFGNHYSSDVIYVLFVFIGILFIFQTKKIFITLKKEKTNDTN